MSTFLENQIIDTNKDIKRETLYKKINLRKNNNNNIPKDNFLKKGIIMNLRNFNDYNSFNFKNSTSNSSYNLIKFNNTKYSNKNASFENNKTPIANLKYINLKDLCYSQRKSLSNNNFVAISIKNQINKIKKNQIKKYILRGKKTDSIKHYFFNKNINKDKSFKNNLFTNEEIKLNLSDTSINDFLKEKFGVYLYNNKYIKEHFSTLRKLDKNKFINEIKKKNLNTDNSNFFNKLKSELLEENKTMRKNVKSSYSILKKRQNIFNSIKMKINSPKEFRKLFYSYNKKRAEKENILTNLYMDETKDPKAKIYNFGEKPEKFNIINENNIVTLAENKINKEFHDLLIFDIPNLNDKFYIRKLLYDVFIEFKNMLLLSMMRNRNIKICKHGLDLDSFYICNEKMNQQGQTIAGKLFKIFNNKSDNKYLSFENYLNGMLKLKNENKEKRLNLFFDMLDESSKGYMSYDDIYKFGIMSLQKITMNLETMEDFEKYKKNKKNSNIKIIEGLADFFVRMIFKLVNIDIKKNIPLNLLKKAIIKGGETADYIEFLFGIMNFT